VADPPGLPHDPAVISSPGRRSEIWELRRWLQPGMGVKRWLLLVFAGEMALALAGALVLRQVYRDVDVTGPVQGLVYLVTLQFLPYGIRGALLAGAGAGLFVLGSIGLIRTLMAPFRPGGDGDQPLVEVIYQKRFLARGPRIVAIGGGTGLSALLRGLKEHTSNLTAVVTVADDGGSSGILREVLGIPPVGDIRNCIAALADAEPLMGRLLQYRFPLESGDPTAPEGTQHDVGPDRLAGHPVGNLLIAAMTAIEEGDFEEGVRQMNRVLAVRGQVLPVSPTPLTLHARLRDGSEVTGQSLIATISGIDHVWLTPTDVRASEDALHAIAEADAIVIGPGSLFTSILPSLLLPEIRQAIAASPAVRVYVCNVATQAGETAGFDLADHVAVLERHTEHDLFDVVLANNRFDARVPGEWHAEPVRLRWPLAPRPIEPASETGTSTVRTAIPMTATTVVARLVLDDVVDPENAHHHDPARLGAAIMRVIEREGGARHRSRVARTA
jgi:uncharacterized cofD-like protein